LLTCKQFLQELDQYLEKSLDPAEYAELQKHVNECPNCFVVCDTTEKTIKVFKGMDCKPVPSDIRARLMAAMEQKMHEKCGHAETNKLDPKPEVQA
jgi:hypothetical protein